MTRAIEDILTGIAAGLAVALIVYFTLLAPVGEKRRTNETPAQAETLTNEAKP